MFAAMVWTAATWMWAPVDLTTYDVRVRRADRVEKKLTRKSSYRDPNGLRWHGGTTYKLRWSWVPTTNGQCRVQPLDVTVEVVLPRVRVPEALAMDMQGYLEDLAAHEQEHAQLVWDEVARLDATLASLPPAPCSRVKEQVTRHGERALAQLSEAHEALDTETKHGATQGARWHLHHPTPE